jgi:hypothetical protein
MTPRYRLTWSLLSRRIVIALAFCATFNAGYFTYSLFHHFREPDPISLLESGASISPAGAPGAPRLWVAFDPYCRYCHDLYRALSARVAAGEIRVAWVPVNVVHADSAAVGAEMLAAVDPSAALDKWFGAELGSSPVVPTGSNSERFLPLISRNTQLVTSLTHGSAVPALIFRGPDSRAVVLVGIPADLDAVLRQIRKERLS